MSENSEGRAVLCVQCGEVIPYDPNEERAKEKAFERMKAHDLVCPKNPLAVRVAELKAALEPFAKFACDPPCGCCNCKARSAITKDQEN